MCAPLARARRSRLELRSDDPAKDGRYKKIALDEKKVDDFFINVFLQAHEEAPKLIVIDLDATDDLLHGSKARVARSTSRCFSFPSRRSSRL